MENLKKELILKDAIILFFLNRCFAFTFLSASSVASEVYVFISECLTVMEILRYIYVRYRKRKIIFSLDKIFIIVVVYFLYLFFDSLIQGTNIRRIFMTAYPIIGTVALIDNESTNNYKELIKGAALFFNISILLNFFDMMFFKNAFVSATNVFLIGGKNQICIALSMALSFVINSSRLTVKSKKTGQEFVDKLFIIVIILSAIFSRSATAILSLVVLLALFYLSKVRVQIKSKVYLVIYTIFWIALIIYRIQNVFSFFIVDKLHKDITLSHRTLIWDAALDLISQKPIFGYGSPDTYNVISIQHDFTGGNNYVWTSISGHNQILQMLYYGGLVLLFIFIWLYCESTNIKTENDINNTTYLFFISVVVISITWLSEVPGEYAMFTMLAVCFYSNRFNSICNGGDNQNV